MKSKHFVLPTAESPFLMDLLDCIRKKSKSIKHNATDFKVERVFEEYADSRVEKLEIEIKPSGHHAYARFEIWEDRWIHALAFERTKAAKWDWECQGKLLPVYSGREFVTALQAMPLIFFNMDEPSVHKFDTIWRPLLSKKPELVR